MNFGPGGIRSHDIGQVKLCPTQYCKHAFHACLPELPVALSYSDPIKICFLDSVELKMQLFIYKKNNAPSCVFINYVNQHRFLLKHFASQMLVCIVMKRSHRTICFCLAFNKQIMQSVKNAFNH